MIFNEQTAKQIMDKVIDETYSFFYDEDMMNKFYDYTLSFHDEYDKCKNNVRGRYFYNRSHIGIFAVKYHPNQAYTIKTCFHELAHHIVYILFKDIEHDEGFFCEYANLLCTAIRLGILTREGVLSDNTSKDFYQVHWIVKDMETNREDRMEFIQNNMDFFTEEDLFPTEMDFLWNEAIYPVDDDSYDGDHEPDEDYSDYYEQLMRRQKGVFFFDFSNT